MRFRAELFIFSENLVINAGMAEFRAQVYTCELCGEDGFKEEDLRSHMVIAHVEGSPSCPFCDINLTPSQLQIHVNSDHLDFLTPESEDGHYLENVSEFGSLWDLEKSAERGLTADGLGCSPGTPGNPFIESDDESDTEDDTTIVSAVEKPYKPSLSISSNHISVSPTLSCAPSGTKRLKSEEVKLDKSNLSLPLRRQTGGCSSISRVNTAQPTSAPSPEVLPCPMCPFTDSDPGRLEEHVNREHLDKLSPAVQAERHQCPLCSSSFLTPGALETHFSSLHTDLSPVKSKVTDPNGNYTCPVCGETSWNSKLLQVHVDAHFSSPGPSKPSQDPISDQILAEELDRREKARQKYKEEKEFQNLRAQYGMDNDGNFREQSEACMMKAVSKGELSVKDFYEKKADIAASVRSGVDDGSSVTHGISEIIHPLSTRSIGVRLSCVSGRMDHYSSTYGDKGWGCGFRNLQMLLSHLLNSTEYRGVLLENLSGNRNLVSQNISLNRNLVDRVGMPSIPRLQEILEQAWRAGFDRAGCEQLGGKIVNTRKWIGATEIYTILTYCGIEAELIDFHKPSGEQGTHPQLVNWVNTYYTQGSAKPPLYLQHQGHSRTICGIERTVSGLTKLLVLDPSHTSRALLENPLRMVRKSLVHLKSAQYQIVKVCGTLSKLEKEERRNKPVSSIRIP
ncbi:zinc finger with UFM1-specific peptidase domain protein [Eurytemora carolleeae]|uniref:zinc finger with UFM1-specific peptidase domain protein n=1 Tax=Eurytemora carolleeae TaxID=1294199 RepID=UPI000C7856F6|nr:zinc finger with UFM1-specific peptidase domain protein [Eurytemora carolleeae]|eukprot:XP_023330509.1 zinc finger with UFM1-specific peptidase domain protein-like [Eurytemora affinis]